MNGTSLERSTTGMGTSLERSTTGMVHPENVVLQEWVHP